MTSSEWVIQVNAYGDWNDRETLDAEYVGEAEAEERFKNVQVRLRKRPLSLTTVRLILRSVSEKVIRED